jgi:hypothetical protein
MHLSQLLKELSFSEFSNLAVGESGSGEISEMRLPSVVAAVNGALLRIYSKFLQDHKTVVLKKLANQTRYVISSEFAESTAAAVPYVMDAADPFKDNILKIISVNYQSGGDSKAITVNVPRTVNLPEDVPAGTLFLVKFRASHPEVVYDDDTFIEAPPSAFEAIKAYVAYKEYSAMNTETGVAKGQEYLASFNALCAELTNSDTIGVTEEFTDTKFSDRGYV